LLCAEGLAKQAGKRVAYVDTERGTDFYCKAVPARKVHPEAFDFDALYTRSLMEALAEVKRLDLTQYGVVVIDSVTHLWEAAMLGYNGRTTSAGTIPMFAWGKIKAPYKEMMNLLLNSPAHVLFCGRQGNEYAGDDDGELKCVGVKMKAEGETPYEPHMLIRMECVKDRRGTGTIQAFAEKDRTGVLQGRTIQWPDFSNLCAPILPYLGNSQGRVASETDVAAHDAERRTEEETRRAAESQRTLERFKARLTLAETLADVKAISKEITAEVKSGMLPQDVATLRTLYRASESRLKGEPQSAGSSQAAEDTVAP
jgi:hypothetical protein